MSEIQCNMERRKGQHLDAIERGKIEGLVKAGYKNRAIARELGRSPSTIANELKRGTPERKGNRGRQPGYHAREGQKVYLRHREKCRRIRKVHQCAGFIAWVTERCKEKQWSLDACVGVARKDHLFAKEDMVCTKTLYSALHEGLIIGMTLFDAPEILKRKQRKKRGPRAVNPKGTSIDERPAEVDDLIQKGNWQIDTVVGKRSGKGAAVMSLIERVTDHYLAVRIDGKNSEAVLAGLMKLREQFGSKFSTVFKTITSDNGAEFSELSRIEAWGTKVYFAHPYSSWERPKNERHNGMLRHYLPKGKPMDKYSAEEIEAFGDMMNDLPRKRLNYRTPSELFEEFLDEVYAAKQHNRQPCQG